jgi:hypothetical protein
VFRFFVAHHVKLPRTGRTKSGRAKTIRTGHKTSTRTVNAPKRW